ncbi:hypothetical protein VNO77_19958 [Canavalia gladiata]|uniref:Uncharacterized protein n=1 Tax=Canavalia gladiata TaxID=3824 RepID=A0AAN9LNG7_CANGL
MSPDSSFSSTASGFSRKHCKAPIVPDSIFTGISHNLARIRYCNHFLYPLRLTGSGLLYSFYLAYPFDKLEGYYVSTTNSARQQVLSQSACSKAI